MTGPESVLCRCCGTLLPGDVVEDEEVRETLDASLSVVCELCQAGDDNHVHHR